MSTAWKNTGLLPTANMLAWHAHDPLTSTSGNINDLSGNARHIIQASNPPTLTENLLYGQHGWVFDGSTNNPLQTASGSTVTPKHTFILAAFEDAEFDAERGLISGKSSGDLLYGTAGTEWDDPTHDAYLKSGVDDGNWPAAMGNVPELMEITDAGGVALDGFSIGRRLADTATKWKGRFFDHISYSSIQTGDELKRIYLYYCLRYAQWRRELPFHFPDSVMTGIPRRRFDERPKDWDKITQDYEFEDGGFAFNEIGPNAPQEWEYGYDIHYEGVGTLSKDPEQLPIFREFWNQARKKNPFNFRDKYGETHEGVRIKNFSKSHDGHRPDHMKIDFELIKQPS